MSEDIKLIQPAPVVRDEYEMFQHLDLPDFEEGDVDRKLGSCSTAMISGSRRSMTTISATFTPWNSPGSTPSAGNRERGA